MPNIDKLKVDNQFMKVKINDSDGCSTFGCVAKLILLCYEKVQTKSKWLNDHRIIHKPTKIVCIMYMLLLRLHATVGETFIFESQSICTDKKSKEASQQST